MRTLVLFALLWLTSPLEAQTLGSSQADPRPFIEGGVVSEVNDSPLALYGGFHGAGEFGVPVWQVGPERNPATVSLRARVERLEDDVFVAFLVGVEPRLTRRLGLEASAGFESSVGASESFRGVAVGLGVPIALTRRVAIVPRLGGFVGVGQGVFGMVGSLGFGLRCRL